MDKCAYSEGVVWPGMDVAFRPMTWFPQDHFMGLMRSSLLVRLGPTSSPSDRTKDNSFGPSVRMWTHLWSSRSFAQLPSVSASLLPVGVAFGPIFQLGPYLH